MEWGAVRDSNQPSVRKSGQGLFASQMAHCLRICGQRGKNGRNGHKQEGLDRLTWVGGGQHCTLVPGLTPQIKISMGPACLGLTAL